MKGELNDENQSVPLSPRLPVADRKVVCKYRCVIFLSVCRSSQLEWSAAEHLGWHFGSGGELHGRAAGRVKGGARLKRQRRAQPEQRHAPDRTERECQAQGLNASHNVSRRVMPGVSRPR
jgi:hypothetical protein